MDPNFNLSRGINQMFTDLAIRYLRDPVTGTVDEERLRTLSLVEVQRMYLLADPALVAALWRDLRASAGRVDYLLELTAAFKYHLRLNEMFFESVVDALRVALSFDNLSESVIDDTLLDQIPHTASVKSLLEANDWLVVFFMLHLNLAEIATGVGYVVRKSNHKS